ncbi:MAG: hypothetical protein HQL32_07375, partial [Planctomycetes bacterium]|nr:hypothetical protein [Planctomycetota bacterium]
MSLPESQKPIAFILIILLSIGAFIFRYQSIESMPVHHDEANQIIKTGKLLEKGLYHYDPHEHHGPSLYYGTLPFLWASAKTKLAECDIQHFRILPLLCGVILILL